MPVKNPTDVINIALDNGRNKTSLRTQRLIILSILAGAYIALGGALSLIAGYGFPDSPAALQKIISGCVFPIGLILIVILGGELFTGNNAMLIPAFMNRDYGLGAVLRNWTIVYFGNFIGALAFAWLMVYLSGLTSGEPYHSAIIKVAETKVSLSWLTVFLRGIGANWCVCLAVWLAMSGRRLAEKMLACWLPVMAFVVLGYEHCIANMFFIPLGMMEGADVSIGAFLIANLVPATIGNIVGGAIFVGMPHAMLHLKRQK
ncbi:MAG: formate/nitrite transporter family protein [Muribaculaceae bacterium]|nr:formate/nitrite transporter family protein [Muribaculaceae bacterium]